MDGHRALELLIFKDEGMPSDLIDRLSINLQLTCDYLKINRDQIQEIPTILQITGDFHDSENKTSVLWDYICCGFYILIDRINIPEDEKSDIFSVAQQKNIRTLLEIILMLGLVPNLIPGVGVPLNLRSQFKTSTQESLTIIEKYKRLRSCANGLLLCNKNFEINKFIISRHLGDLLAVLFQLSFAPLKKPLHTTNEFQMTEELWDKLQSDRIFFRNNLNNLLNVTYLPPVIREIMVLMGVQKPPAPRWLKIECSRILCELLARKDGILALCYAMFESQTVDIGAQWKHMEILQKLIFDIGNSNLSFYQKISSQILKMLSEVEDDNSKHLHLIITRLFCKSLIEQRKEIFESEIFSVIVEPLNKCIPKSDLNKVVTESELKQSLKFVYQIFILEINSKTEILLEPLIPYTDVIFQIYVKLFSDKNTDKKYAKLILIKILNNSEKLSDVINLILFRKESKNLYKFCNNLEILTGDNGIYVKKSSDKISYKLNETDESFQNLLTDLSNNVQAKIFQIIFNEFSNMFCESEKVNLLLADDEKDFISTFTANKLFSLKILAYLAEKKSVIEKLDVSILIKFVNNLFEKYEKLNTEDFVNSEGLFLSLMLLDILIDNSIELNQLTGCMNSLEAVANKTKNTELKTYITQTCTKIRNGGKKSKTEVKSEFDQALEEICDPLLPVRAHGLMSLKKLIETKDKIACARKQYILCVFQENLKNDDSYIYLAAINGIAALSTSYTDNVLEILTEEYVNLKEWRNEEEHHRVRLNLGEVLVQVTKKLGEMASKYKTILLNTFLFGAKDDDNLIRTSSLSNLGQICEVLGYKLGNATTEILHCLDAIIETDKAIEARRAAVMVMYQLLKGFGPDTIVCLKEALLPIYRKLKDIYIHEKDDIMRLHAQLALEELNNSTRNFLLPPTPFTKTINIFDDISL